MQGQSQVTPLLQYVLPHACVRGRAKRLQSFLPEHLSLIAGLVMVAFSGYRLVVAPLSGLDLQVARLRDVTGDGGSSGPRNMCTYGNPEQGAEGLQP